MLLFLLHLLLLLLSLAEGGVNQAAYIHDMCVLQAELFLHFQQPELEVTVLLMLTVSCCTRGELCECGKSEVLAKVGCGSPSILDQG